MTFDYELTLISVAYSENELGDPIFAEQSTKVLCDGLSVTRSEHYTAASHGLKPEIVFVVNQFEYSKQSMVEFEGVKYKVIRDFKRNKSAGIGDFETIELICSGYINDGDSNG